MSWPNLSKLLPLSLLYLLGTPPILAQRVTLPQLKQTSQLKETGNLQAAAGLLLPLLQPGSHLNESETGAAWNLLGSIYQDMEEFEKARRCYETASKKLEGLPAEQAQYAAAVENLGSVELAVRQLNDSKRLQGRARDLYQRIGNHAGMSRTSGELAMIALAQGDLRGAQRDLTVAFRETKLGGDSSGEDWATLLAVQGALAAAHKDYRAAALAYQQMIDQCIRDYGLNYSQLGSGYELLGQAETRLGDYQKAMSDLTHAMAIDAMIAPGMQSIRYLQTELDYSRTLRAAGSTKKASILEKQAINALKDLGQRRCDACTISFKNWQMRAVQAEPRATSLLLHNSNQGGTE